MNAAYRQAVAHLKALDFEGSHKQFEQIEGSIADRFEKDEWDIAVGGLLIAVQALNRIERMTLARTTADEHGRASCEATARNYPRPVENRITQNGPHILEASELKGRTL